MSKSTDAAPVVGDGECSWNNPMGKTTVDTFLAIPEADDTERTSVLENSIGADTQLALKSHENLDDTDLTSVVQSSIGAETQPVPELHETLKELPPIIHAFMTGVDLKSMRKSWSATSPVSTPSESSESESEIIPGNDRSTPYSNTDEGDGDIFNAKRLHVGTFYVCKPHEKRKSRYEYEDLGMLLETFDALGYKSHDDRNLTSQRVMQIVDTVLGGMDDEAMCTYSIYTLYK